MAGSDIRAGAAFVELYVKGSFEKDLASAQKKLKAFGDSLVSIGTKMLGVGAAIIGPLALAARQFAEMGDAVNKASQRTGIAVEELSALKYAAEQSGLSFEDFEGAIRKMEKSLFNAADGSKSAMEALASLGLTAKELQGLSPDEQFLKIADALSKVSDTGTKAALAMEIFGKGGTALLPLIETGANGITALTKRAQELGLVMSKDDAQAATKFGDTMSDLYKQIKQVVFIIGAAVANALQPFADAATNILKTVIAWVNANRPLVVGFLIAGVAIATAGAALLTFGIAIKAIISVGSALATVMGAISSAIAFLLNPIVLVGTAIAGLAAYFVYSSGVMGQAIDWLQKRFGELGETFKTVIGGIADALSAGDIQLAAQILWVGLQLAWAQGTKELMAGWVNFRYEFVKVAVAAFYGAEEIWENVKAGIISSFYNFTAILGDAWDGFTNLFSNGWDTAISNVAKGMLYVKSLFDGSDYKAEAAEADAQLEANKGERDKAAQASIAQREAQLKADLNKVEQDRGAALKAIDKDQLDLTGGANDAKQQELDALTAKKADLEKQLAELRNKAQSEAKSNTPAPLFDQKKFDLDEILANRGAIKTPAKANGIFNVAALQSLQSTATDEYIKQTAKNTEKIAKNSSKVALFK